MLIGVQSRAPANARMASGQTWLGNPPLALPAREQTAGFPEHLTFRPSLGRKLARGAVEGMRMILPLAVVIAVGYLTVMKVIPMAVKHGFVAAFDELMLAGVLYGIGAFLFLVLLKWTLIGRYRPRAEPMWTPFVWKSEAVTSLYESIAVPNFFNFLRATPWLPLALRCMGARIGKRVFMDTTDVTEYDCVAIGDDAVLHAWSGPQTHLFEDRVMKIGQVRIGAGVSVGPRTTILYDTRVEQGAVLGPLTLVLKGETIPAGQAWMGSPATRGRGAEAGRVARNLSPILAAGPLRPRFPCRQWGRGLERGRLRYTLKVLLPRTSFSTPCAGHLRPAGPACPCHRRITLASRCTRVPYACSPMRATAASGIWKPS